jgi:Kae1-associated kinase Bud32
MILGQGAEAVLRKEGDLVVKDRVAKEYRLPVIDTALRRSRTRREARILDKLQKLNFPAPRVSSVDEEKMHVVMGYIDGPQVKEVLHDNPAVLSREIGRKVGILHANDIIHGDLTTSNMILSNGEVHFIDFGLSNVSTKAEDKAVDLHLLDRALESKHHKLYAQCVAAALEGYKETNPHASEVLARLEKVEQRGRNKKK